MDFVGVANWESKLIGVGCDGANVNMGTTGGLKGLITATMPWVVVFWCLAHRLELALRDALKQTFLCKWMTCYLEHIICMRNPPKNVLNLKL